MRQHIGSIILNEKSSYIIALLCKDRGGIFPAHSERHFSRRIPLTEIFRLRIRFFMESSQISRIPLFLLNHSILTPFSALSQIAQDSQIVLHNFYLRSTDCDSDFLWNDPRSATSQFSCSNVPSPHNFLPFLRSHKILKSSYIIST
ncbi:unnamed protein product [Cuscuta epithymum]|uniref:Maturase K n=1 Tax=Cuscuta epithymum TaxID=186058 RepID=A0AAV0FJU5_9ASTE|nr:unnamed protein product [Cuscuta epithymum]